jgi:large subunit ribosomal protein L29
MAQTKQIAKLRNMSPEELDKEEMELREEVWKLRLQRTTGQLQDPYKVRQARRNLARLLTVRRELAGGAAKGASR